jgi:hypothetical protein
MTRGSAEHMELGENRSGYLFELRVSNRRVECACTQPSGPNRYLASQAIAQHAGRALPANAQLRTKNELDNTENNVDLKKEAPNSATKRKFPVLGGSRHSLRVTRVVLDP